MARELVERASDRAYRLLRSHILEFELEPGEVIGEVETAAQLGVSRTPLREALARLLADGLLVQEGARGVAVAPISSADTRQLSELREALDTQAARLAAQRRDALTFELLAERFSALAANLPGPDGPGADRDATYELAAQLDDAIDAAAANPALAEALARVRLRLARIRRLAQDRPDRLAEAAGEHRAIAEAIAWGDPELAANAVRLHLRRSLQHALVRLDERDGALRDVSRSEPSLHTP
ncbi:MAG: GntR family transcriptional regulator [Leucobacter sp.]|nr:GntR family transcriptional regulator [Leucobacter sp.]